ncbi:AMP-binding protein [Pseudorhodoferax sp. LjRoot39]|uniref:AMP-binding protein n=1 Tax=Pseudorhodoferax sp. LjRoot39 TaxID=3342328 RepID=UPI003ED08979
MPEAIPIAGTSTPAINPHYLCAGALGFWKIAEQQPGRIAIVHADGGRSTFGELRERVDRLSHALRACGTGTGDAVAVLLPNTGDWLASALAIAQIGAYLVPLNWHLTAEDLAYLLSNSASRVLLADHRFAAAASQAARQAKLPAQGRLAVAGSILGFRDLQPLLDAQPPGPPADRLAGSVMFYSSGTTGRPKGIRRPLTGGTPEAALARTLPLYSGMFGLRAGDGRHLVCTPLYHAAPGSRAIQMLHLGHRVVLLEKWDGERVFGLIERERIDSVQLVPILFHRLLQLPEEVRRRHDLSSLRTVIHAAAPCPPETKRRMIDWLGPVLYEYYACSEGGGTYVGSEDWLRHPGTVGRAYPFSQLAILDDDGNALAPGEPGLVYMHDGFDFEYFNDPQKTRAAKRGALFTAGDYGYLDAQGWLYLCDRRSDLILSGGVNIYPAEIEAALMQHPAVSDAVVLGLPDPEWGQSVFALVQPRDAAAPAELAALRTELIAYCGQRLASFKRPRELLLGQVPRTDAGKVGRAAVRQALLDGRLRPLAGALPARTPD